MTRNIRAPKSPLRSVPGQTCRFKIDGVEFAAIETPDQSAQRNGASEVASRLTGRELEIAVLVAQGCATRRIFAKLDVSSRAEMVYRCAPLINRVADLAATTKQLS